MAEQRICLCGHFGSIEFELLQILQGRHLRKRAGFTQVSCMPASKSLWVRLVFDPVSAPIEY